MNELRLNNTFDYSVVSEHTKEILLSKENELAGIYSNYSKQVGKVCFEAQQELSDYNNDGIFGKWIESVGLKRQRAYEYINIYKYAVRISDNEELEIFDKQPKSMQIEMSKPSAKPELNQKVYDGDITTHKDYKEQEKIIKEQKKTIKEKNNKIKELENKKTEEVVPHDYDGLKSDNIQLEQVNRKLRDELEGIESRNQFIEKNYQNLLEQRAEVDEKSKKYDELTEAIQNAEGKLNDTQKLISDYNKILNRLRKGNEALMQLSGLAYLDIAETVNSSDLVSREFDSLIRSLERLANDLRAMRKENIIIEGDFKNE